ncbi:multidrug effflux MFS transporter [Alphaproteobacteria bacterium]|nr:multidrug effflux MFS transporter [Alphaproteobacteria bacterium]
MMKNFQRLFFPYALVFYEAILYLSNDMYLPSLPNIAQELRTSQDMAQYTLAIWFLGTCTLQLFLSPLSDRFGRRPMLLWGCLLFFISNLVCAYAETIEGLLLGRFLQGSVVGTVTVVGYAAVHEFYDSKKTVQLLSIMASIIVLAPAVGPILGAGILEYTSWRFIFQILAGMGVLGGIGIYILMPKDKAEKKEIILKRVMSQYGSLLKNKSFMRYGMAFCIILSSFFIWIVESPFVIIEGLKRDPSVFGWAQVFVFGCFGVGSQIAKVLIREKPVSYVIRLAIFTLISGGLLFVLASTFTSNLYLIVAAVTVVSLGASISLGSLNRLAIESSDVTMVSRTAVLSLLVSITGTIASFVMTLVNNRTFFNLSIVMFLFVLAGVALIWPGSKKIKFRDNS